MNNVNPFQIELESFFVQVNDLASLSGRVKYHLIEHKETLINSFVGIENELLNGGVPIMANTLIIEDLTNPNFNIHYPTGALNSLYFRDINTHFSELITREYYLALSTCYELLKKYIKDLTAGFIYVNKHKFKEYTHFSDISEIREYIGKNNFRKGKNEKELFKLIRDISPMYKNSETNNNWRVNLYSWFYILSEIRNGVIHTYPKIMTIQEYKNLNIEKRKVILNLFNLRLKDNHYIIDGLFQNTRDNFKMITEFAFTLFKCYSIDSNFEWKILKHMD